jgi:hypothetical protein
VTGVLRTTLQHGAAPDARAFAADGVSRFFATETAVAINSFSQKT